MKKEVFIASDHAGYRLKQLIVASCDVTDLGLYSSDVSVDYNDFAGKLVSKIFGTDNFGILICKTGIGMSIAANRHRGIRAALCIDIRTAKMTREHNNANVLVLPADVQKPLEIVEMFLQTNFSGEERHVRRIKKLG